MKRFTPVGGVSCSNGWSKTLQFSPKNWSVMRDILYILQQTQATQDVVEVGDHQQQDEQAEADILCLDHEVLGGFAARDNLVEQEQHVTTVEGRNGQDVHEGEDDAEEGGHLPEDVPVPHRREEVADGSEASQRLGTFGAEDVLQVIDIGRQHVPAVLDASREALEESVFAGDGLIDACQRLDDKSQLEVGSKHDVGGVTLSGESVCR